jgi:hypothetical protein
MDCRRAFDNDRRIRGKRGFVSETEITVLAGTAIVITSLSSSRKSRSYT